MGSFALAVLVATSVTAGGTLKSGPPVGAEIPGAFHPLNVTGSHAGEKHCLVWSNGGNPVVMIFAREVSDSLTSLVKKIDAETAKNSQARMGSFVVFMSSDEKIGEQLKALADKEKITKCILTLDNPAGPEDYKIAKDADVTVVLYNNRTIMSNRAFKKGELNAKGIDAVLADLPKILEKKAEK
jgi:hypothetical protein